MTGWKPLESPGDLGSPDPIIVRVESLPARSYFVEHSHTWNQLVYAVSGVLTVSAEGRSMAISPEQAVWLPTGIKHTVGSLMGAEFRSLWVAHDACPGIMSEVSVVEVSGLLRALIIEGASLNSSDDRDYASRIVALMLDQLQRARTTSAVLPWPKHPTLLAFCEALYADPANPRDIDEWGHELGMSSRTLTRRFEQEVGMSLRAWRLRLRLFKSIELLCGDAPITEIALDLGYASASAFIFMFRKEMGYSPLQHRRRLAEPNRPISSRRRSG
jgi:AraC-like DNA-binding protein